MSDSLQPHGPQPIRFLHPWDFLGKGTGARWHCLLHPRPLALLNTWTDRYITPHTCRHLSQGGAAEAPVRPVALTLTQHPALHGAWSGWTLQNRLQTPTHLSLALGRQTTRKQRPWRSCDFLFLCAAQTIYKSLTPSLILGWPKNSFRFFCNILGKHSNELFCRLNISFHIHVQKFSILSHWGKWNLSCLHSL